MDAEADGTNGKAPGRKRGKKSENWIHFRVNPELRNAIDKIVENLAAQGVPSSRSAVARAILNDHLGMDPVQAEVQESMKVVWAITQKAMHKITSDAGQKMPEYLETGMAEYYEQRVGAGTRE